MPLTSGRLTANGAIIDVQVGVGPRRAAVLRRNGLRLPPPVTVRAQIDTGSGPTGFALRVFQALELSPVGDLEIITPSTPFNAPHVVEVYEIGLAVVANGSAHPFDRLRVIASECFDPATEEGVEGLIGRDVLDRASFSYFGPDRQFTFGF